MTHDDRRLQFDVRPRKRRMNPNCRKKRYFDNELAARAGALLALSEWADVPRLWIYKCKQCPGWHLTSKDQGKALLVTAGEPIHDPSRARARIPEAA